MKTEITNIQNEKNTNLWIFKPTRF